MADYVHMTNISIWHIIDRCLACTLMSLELVKLLVMSRYTRPMVYVLGLMCCGFAMCCFLQSQKAQQALDADGFVFWHNGWHLYPITGSLVHLLDYYLNQRWGEYYSFEEEEESEEDVREEDCPRHGEHGGILLSTIAMSQASMNDGKIRRSPRANKGRQGSAYTNRSPGLRRSRRLAGQRPEL